MEMRSDIQSKGGGVSLSEATLVASDGHRCTAALARRKDECYQAGIVVMPEMFGFTDYVKKVCIRLAESGYLALTPSLYDRIDGPKSFSYDQDPEAYHAATKALTVDVALMDLDAGLTFLEAEDASLPLAVIGFSYGATLGWLAASRSSLDIRYFAGYYGSRISLYTDEIPMCPYHLHFGESDKHLSDERRALLLDNLPSENLLFYEGAKHGFDCSDRPEDYCAQSSQLAFEHLLSELARVSKN